jgi:hypothetical protein
VNHAGRQQARGFFNTLLDLWRVALPAWRTDEFDLMQSISHRDAALAAARLDLWAEAGQLLWDGAERAAGHDHAAFCIGMLIDAGFASWKAGNSAQALSYFATGLQELDKRQADADTNPVYPGFPE